ncbi:MAG: hypothetical protein MR775_02040, partial [Erysipelotrichaceae bacterium]|nr:hypothetical protein [Erysipelotrichaceae bacterium]
FDDTCSVATSTYRCLFMLQETNFRDFVESLSIDELLDLEREIRYRKWRIKLGGDDFSDLAIKYGREPICPKCKSHNYIRFGLGNNKRKWLVFT